ncbi:MAG: DUF420 domain-containing protein [Gemmatimonadota bacterium]
MTELPSRPMGLDRLSERALGLTVYGLTGLVCLLVLILVVSPTTLELDGVDVSLFPAFHALLNGTCVLLLVAGFLFIRGGNVRLHRFSMVGAFVVSCIFLLSYVFYHAQSPGTTFGGEGWIRPVYFFVLVSHIALAPVVIPLALYAVIRALRGEFERHRAVVRWTLPVWLYVAVTGVMIYLLMAPYY